jgi:hypothetical protein
MGQLGWILLSGSSGSPDEQAAVPDEGGGYGELMDEIDRLLQEIATAGPRRPDR